jgi:peroxiredoxin
MTTSDRHQPRAPSDPAFLTEFRAAVDSMVAELQRSGAVPGIAVGERAPDFTLPDAQDRAISLGDRLNDGPVVLSFYRGEWCPICNTELHDLQAILPEIRARGANLIAVSPQAPDISQAFVKKLELGFDVLSDLDQHVSAEYRIKFRGSEAVEALYLECGCDLSSENADHTWDLPVPATFVIDTDRVVRARHVEPDYRQRMDPTDILTALDQITGR